jgi:hypothetical protein
MTAADLRAAVPALENQGRYSDAQLDGYVAEFKQLAESYRGGGVHPPVGRRDADDPIRCAADRPQLARVRSIASVVIDGGTVDASTYRSSEAGVLMSSTGVRGRWRLP